MSDMNSMTRIVGNKRVPCIVIDKETGERLHRHAIDAKEMVGDGKGRYKWADDVEGVTITEVKLDKNGNPIPLVDVVVPAEPVADATPVADVELTEEVADADAEPDEVEDDEPAADEPAPTAAKAKATKGAKKATKGAKK